VYPTTKISLVRSLGLGKSLITAAAKKQRTVAPQTLPAINFSSKITPYTYPPFNMNVRPAEPRTTRSRSDGTLQKQDSLPKMPIAPLEDTISAYLQQVLPCLTAEQAEATKAKAALFLETDGPSLHEKLLAHDAQTENYLEDFYREIYTGYEGSNHSLNPTFVMFPKEGCDTAPKSAANLVAASLQHYVHVRDGAFPIQETRKGSLCMRQMPWLYGTARVPSPAGMPDDLVNSIDESKHIAVLCRGAVYNLPVVGDQGQIIASKELLEARFEEIMQHASSLEEPQRTSVPALTTGDRNAYHKAREVLTLASPDNAASFSTVDSALFVVAIDVGASGLSAEEMSRNVLYGLEGTNYNRWMDKWNIIVCEDGQAGLNWEHSMLDGHTMMEYYAEIGKEYDSGAPVEPDEAACVVTPVPFDVVDDETLGSIATAIDSATTKTTGLGQECLEFQGFGGTFIKGSKCSPDGFVQAAMMISYYQVKQKIPVPYESVLAKAYKHGRVTVARNMSELIANNLKAWEGMATAEEKVEAYRATIADISRICAAAAKAQDVDRPMLGYRRIASDEGLENPSIVDDAGWTRFGEIDLCTSHCGRAPIRFFGFEPPSADGFSVGYYVDKNSMQFSITHFDKAEAKKFSDTLEVTLNAVKGLFEEVAAKGAAEE